MIGTFLSIYFGDEMIDVVKHEEREKYHKHKHKYYFVFMLFLIVVVILVYDWLLNRMGIGF